MPEPFRLTNAALTDLKNTARYTQEKYGVGQRKRYLAQLNEKFVQLSKNLHLGRERPELKVGLRSVVEGSHVVFYRVADKRVEVVRVLHGNMEPKRRL